MNARTWVSMGALAAVAVGATSFVNTRVAFDMEDPKGVNAIHFKLDSRLEPIKGSASGIAGEVSFDPQAPEATTARIVVATDSLATTNPVMTEHLHGERWLNAEANPTIVFELKELESVERHADAADPTWSATATGDLTINGVTQEVEAEASLTYLEGQMAARMRGAAGDLTVLRTQFEIERAAFGIGPEVPFQTVAEFIEIDAAIVGLNPE